MPNKLSRTDYDRLGAMKNLVLLASPPALAETSALWKCSLCGKEQSKSYRSLRLSKTGCSCQDPKTTKVNKYVLLATKLGLRWVGATQPTNTKVKTLWQSRDGKRQVEASYAQLAYMPLSQSLKELLAL